MCRCVHFPQHIVASSGPGAANVEHKIVRWAVLDPATLEKGQHISYDVCLGGTKPLSFLYVR